MENYLTYIVPVFAMAFLAAAWMAVQLLARKMKTKNHIEDFKGCCGVCEKKKQTQLKNPDTASMKCIE